MKKPGILTVAAIAAVVTLTPSLTAGDCAASKSASDNAKVVRTNSLAENGVIHVIGRVILPNS